MQRVCVCVAVLTLGVCAILTSGCILIPVAAGAVAGVVYSNGKLESHIDAPVAKTAEAAKSVLEEMQCNITKYTTGMLDGEVTGKTADSRVINVELRYATDTSCRIFIRVGTFGDEALSQTVLSKIKAKLGVK